MNPTASMITPMPRIRDLPELVGISEISRRLGRPLPTVKMWRGDETLPEPDVELSCGPVWQWERIRRWAVDTGRMDA